jgi:hypothetical protein
MRVALLLVVLGIQEGVEDVSYEYADEAVIQQALAETLAQPEFARLARGEEPSQNAPEWLLRFFRWLRRLFEGGDDGTEVEPSALPAFLRVPILLGVLLVVVLFLVKALSSARRRRSAAAEDASSAAAAAAPGSAPGEIDPEEYWRRALEHGGSGRYRDGIRELLLGAMSDAERRGSIRYRRGLTNRDYVYALRGPARLSFGSIASAFERVFFGRLEATPESYEECRREYQKSFRGAAR